MHLPNFCGSAFTCLSLLAFQQSYSQQIAEGDKQAAIQTIANQIAIHYYDEERGGQIASYLQTRYHDGDFAKANDWIQFDDMVTKSLREYSKDGHLYVKNNPAVVSSLNGDSKQDNSNISGKERNFANHGFSETTVMDGNIGYMKISTIDISKESLPALQKAMEDVKDTKALIIDLRDNGGGGSEIGSVLESYFLPANRPLLEFKTRDGSFFVDSTVGWLNSKPYQNPLYIIVNKKTASAAEAFAFVMQQNKRATIVGERSAGAANMNEYFPVNNDNYVSVSTASPSLPGKRISWEQKGIIPEMKSKTDDPLTETLGKINKR